jgi:long-chain acyl-CoA synthetase
MMQQQTLPQVFVDNVKKRGNKPFLFYKHEGRWCAVAWNEVGEKVKYMSLGLMSLGVKKDDRIAPISNTNPEMVYCCLAIATSGAIFSPIYHTNSPKECIHVINDSGARIAFAEDQIQLEKLKVAWNDCPHLEKIIVLKAAKPDDDPRIMTLEHLIELGKKEFKKNGDQVYYERIQSVRPEDLTAIIYTSGTTGPPKGVRLTIKGMIKNLTETTKLFPVSEKSRGISILPMAHQLELMNGHWYHVFYGFPQVYAESLKTLYDDVREMKPTFFFTTPRFYEKIYNEMMSVIDASPAWKKNLIHWCLSIGARYQDMKDSPSRGIGYGTMKLLNSMGRFIFFRKVHAAVGGKMEWSSTGSAPIPAKILLFFRACDFSIYEGYGLTESAGMVSINRPSAVKVGTVGKPMDGVELTFTEDNEILVKGWPRCAGYWNNHEATEELFRDGWLHTGDLGYLDEDGYLKITGRKKDILITSTGKNISPLNIENHLKTIPYISHAVVFGEGQTYLTALVTLDEEKITQYANEKNITYNNVASLTQHPAMIDLIGKEIEMKNQDLARIEQIKKFTILGDQFQQDRDELTPTLKVKRRVVEQRYKDKIMALYKKE